MISLDCAQKIYGVAINKLTMKIDFKKTIILRKKMSKKRDSFDITEPNLPGASDWVKKRLRTGDTYLIDPQ